MSYEEKSTTYKEHNDITAAGTADGCACSPCMKEDGYSDEDIKRVENSSIKRRPR